MPSSRHTVRGFRTIHEVPTRRRSTMPNSRRWAISNTADNVHSRIGNLVRRFRVAAMPRLSHTPFYLTDESRKVVAAAFAKVVARLRLERASVCHHERSRSFPGWRSKYTIEYLVNQLKGGATLALGCDRTPWTRSCWKVFVNDELSLRAAAEYVDANPLSGWTETTAMGFCDAAAARAPRPPCRRPLNWNCRSHHTFSGPFTQFV